jgi:co-chaperonin GroES (HSP10)
MAVVVPHRVISEISKSADPKAAILAAVEPSLPNVEVMYNMVLVATYIRPEKTSGGIIRPDTNVQEDVWQGKVGLVVKLGPNAFKDDSDFTFSGQEADVGEWCVYKVGDAWSLNIGGVPCRLVRDSNIRMKITDPNVVF